VIASEAIYDCYAAGRSLALLVNGYKGAYGPPHSIDKRGGVTPNGYIPACEFLEKLKGAD